MEALLSQFTTLAKCRLTDTFSFSPFSVLVCVFPVHFFNTHHTAVLLSKNYRNGSYFCFPFNLRRSRIYRPSLVYKRRKRNVTKTWWWKQRNLKLSRQNAKFLSLSEHFITNQWCFKRFSTSTFIYASDTGDWISQTMRLITVISHRTQVQWSESTIALTPPFYRCYIRILSLFRMFNKCV